MSAVAAKRSAILRLLSLLGQPHHPYRPSTQVFLDLNVDRLADDLALVKHGTERGAENRPAQDAQTLDDIEHQVVERIEGHKQDAHALYLDHLHTYDERMTALNFEDRFAVIHQAAPEAVGDFRAAAALGRDELFELRPMKQSRSASIFVRCTRSSGRHVWPRWAKSYSRSASWR